MVQFLPSGVEYQNFKIIRSSHELPKFINFKILTPPTNFLLRKCDIILAFQLLMLRIHFQKTHRFLTSVKTHLLNALSQSVNQSRPS